MIKIGSGANSQEQKPDWSLSSLGMNFASGYVEGLTTFDILKEASPDTTAEYVARSLGSVLGFIGWLPTPGGIARLGLLSAGRTMNLLGDAVKGTELLAKASKIKSLTFSIPSAVGKLGASGVERFFESSAAKATMDFTENLVGRQLMSQSAKEATKHLIGQAAFMGFASAAGAKPINLNPLEYFSAEDFKTRSNAFLEGIPYGLAQGVIANAITKQTMAKIGFASLADMPKEKQEFILKSMRAVSSGLTMAGYTSYSQDVPIEYTIYEGLLNGVFGYREPPYQMKEANRLVAKHFQDQNTVHGQLIGKSKGDINKYLIDRGENPSEGVMVELDGIIEHYYGKQFAQTMLPELMNPEIAKLLGTTVEDLQHIPPSEIASVLGKPELKQLEFLQTDMIKGIQDDAIKERVKNFETAYKRQPTEEEIQEMQQDQYPESTKQVAEMTPKLIEYIKETSSRVNVAMSSNNTFVEKQLAINKAMEETGVPRTQANALLDILHKPGMDELKIVTDVGKIFYDNKKSGQMQYGSVKDQVEKKLGYQMDDTQNKNVRTLWQMYSNSVLSEELTYNADNGTLDYKPSYNKAGIDQREHRDRMNYEIEFNKNIISIKDIEGSFGKNGARKTLNLYESWKDADWNDISLNVNKFLHTVTEHGYNFIGNRKDDYHAMVEKKGDINYDGESNSYLLEHKGKTYQVNLREGFNQIDQAELETGSYEKQAEVLGIKFNGYQSGIPMFTDASSATGSTFLLGKNETVLQALNRKRIQFKMVPSEGPNTSYNSYISDRTKYVEDNSGKSYADTDPSLQKKLEKEYDDMTANHMLKWMALNRKQNMYEIFSSPGSTIRGAFPYTTRLQVLAGGGIALDPSVVDKTHFKNILIETRNGELLNNFGEHESVQKDGVDIYLSHIQPLLADAIGVDKTNAFFKPAIAVSLDTGLHLRKEGAHQATPANEIALKEVLGDIDFASFVGSAAKQPGDIPTVFLDMDANGKYIVTDRNGVKLTPEEIEMVKFNIPVESIRLNVGVNEQNSNDELHMIKQMLSNTGELKDHMYNEYILPQALGTIEENAKYKNLKTGEEIDLDKVDVRELLKAFHGEDFHKTTPQTLAWARKMLDYELSKGDEIEGDGESELIGQLQKLRTSISLSIMGTGRENITAEFLRRPDIRDYMEQVMYKYISDRLQRPRWDGFGTNSRIAYGLSPVDAREFKLKHGRDFSQGDFMLGVEARNQIRTTPKELRELIGKDKVSLGELWDTYQKPLKVTEDIWKKIVKESSQPTTTTDIIDMTEVNKIPTSKVMSDLKDIIGIEKLNKAIRDFSQSQESIYPDRSQEAIGTDVEIFIRRLAEKLGNQDKNVLLEDYFSRTIAARSPQSDASGSRRLTFRGFNGPGWGVTLHPMDMKYLDGADLDGDAVKLYMGFDKKFVDYVDQTHIKHRFSRFFSSPAERDAFFRGDVSKGLTIRQVLARPDAQDILTSGKYLEEFAMEKGHNPYLKGKSDDGRLKRTYSMFSPSLVAEAGRQATIGKNNLGWGLANANRGRELGNYLRAWNEIPLSKLQNKKMKIEVEGGKYFLQAKNDPEDFNRTVWDIVNSCADATKGKNPPVDPGTMRVVGGVLSVADVYDKNGKPADIQEFINYVKQKGMKVVPIIKQLGEVDNMLHLRDYEGNRRNLQDIFPMLKQAVAKAKDRIGNADLQSTWYRTAQFMSEMEYNPSPTDHTNMVTSDIVRRSMDAFVKSNTPVSKFLISTLGRTGLNFNNSYILQTPIWKEIVAAYKGDSKELLSDFINPPGNDYRNSKAFDLAGHMPSKRHGITENRQAELQNQLVATATEKLIERAKTWPGKRSVSYETKSGETKTEIFDSQQEAEAWIGQRTDGDQKGKYTIGKVMRTKGEQIKYVQELYMNDDTDMVSLSLVNDFLSKYVDKVLPKENLIDESLKDLLKNDIRPFTQEVSNMKDYIYETHNGIVNPYQIDAEGRKHWLTAEERKKSFRSWEDALKNVEKYRASLNADKKQLFDALWLSSLNFNERSSEEFHKQAVELAIDKNDDKEIEGIKNDLIAEAESNKFKTLRGKTALVIDIADPEMVKAYFKKLSTLAELGAGDNVSIQKVADAMNISELTKNFPAYTLRNQEFDAITTRQDTESKTRISTSPLKRILIEEHGKDRLGNITDIKERAEYNDFISRWKNLVKNSPEMVKDFELNFGQVMAEKYGKIGYDVSTMTKQDFKLFLDYMEGRQYNPNEVAKVKQSFFLMRFGRIANAMQSYQKEMDKFKFQFLRPIVTADGPMMKKVQAVLSHFDIIKKFADAHSLASNAMLSTQLKMFETHLGHINSLDKAYGGLGRQLSKIVVATRLQKEHINRVPLEGKKNLFLENYNREMKNYERIPDIDYRWTTPDGKTIAMKKGEILDYIQKGWYNFNEELSSGLYNRPYDKLIVYNGKLHGKQQVEEIDPQKTFEAMAQHTLSVGGAPPDMSAHALMELAAWYTLKNKTFDILTTSNGDIYFDSQMGPKQREAFDRALSDNINGYTYKEKVLFENMTEAEQNAVMDNLYPNGNIAGFNLNERMDKRGINYWHHMTMNKKTQTEYLKEKYQNLLKGLSAEDAKTVTHRLMQEIAATTNQEDNLTFGQEFSARLHDKESDPIRSLHIHPNSILGELDLDNPMPDWELGPEAQLAAYQKVHKMRYDMQFALMGKYVVDDMRKRQVFGEGESTQHLANFGERYIRQVFGFQDVNPPEVGDGYNYGLKTNWFKFHSDSYWNKKITDIADTWFGKKIFPEYEQLAGIASQIKFKDETEKKKWIEQSKKNLSEKKVTWLSQSEAKWSLISLLTSFKTAITNVTSAEIMTFINSGFDAYKRSFKLKDIQDEFGSNVIRNRGDLQTIFENLGGYETMYLNEYGMDASVTKAMKQSAIDIMQQASKKNWNDIQIKKAIQDANLMDLFVNKASWFMKASERIARSHSMLSHYINARRVFRQAGFELDYDDPWIMQIAREGVGSSQFLYSNAERPAFMASAMGKVFHRFQLYAYNSVEFRYNALKGAQMAGIAPGSDDQKKFERMMAADLFMFGMASLVPFSIFGSALQAPYNGIQNSLQYLFGTDQEKKKSFFSPLPYPANIIQPIIPPGLREIPQLFGLFAPEGDLSKKVGDAVSSWMPFQRIGKDIGKTIDNPTMIIDNMTGIPFIQVPQIGRRAANMTTFDEYLDRYRNRASLSNSKKIEIDINQYLDQYPSP